LDGVVAAALAGTGGRTLLVGDPGMGKTALLDALRRRASRRGLRCVHARAAQGQQALPGSLLEDMSRVAGWDAGMESPDQGWDTHCLAMLRSLAAGTPVLLTVDDCQFADGDSLATLRTAVERAAPLALSIVLAAEPRPAVLRCLAAWPRLVLEPLDSDAAEAILRASLGPGRRSPVLATIAEALHGNPLALHRAALLLSDEQLTGHARLPDPMPVPDELTAAWTLVLEDLTPAARGALIDLAVAGGRQDLLALMSASAAAGPHAAPAEFEAGLDEAMQVGLVALDSPRHPAFASPTLRDVVRATAPPAQLRTSHRRAAAAAQSLNLPPGVVVDHLARSVLTADAVTAAAVAEQAARAEQEELLEVAARAWHTAAVLTDVASDRVGYSLCAVRLFHGLGLPAPEGLLTTLAAQYLDPGTRAQVAVLRAEQGTELDPQAALPAMWAQIDQARVLAPGTVPTLLCDAAHTAWSLGDAEAGLRAARQCADAIAQGMGDPEAGLPPWTGTALLAAGLFQAGDVARAMPLRRQAIGAARGVDPRALDLPILLNQVSLDDLLLDISPEATDRLLVAAHRVGPGEYTTPCLYGIQGWRARARGDWHTARALLAAGRPLAEANGLIPPWLGMTALSVELAALCGDDAGLQADSRRLRDVGSRCGDRRRLATLDRALGLRALLAGQLGDAIAWLSAAADVDFLGRGLRDAVLPARVDLIEALVRTGDLAEAARRHAELHRLLTDMGDPLATALDERTAALVTGHDEAEDHFATALAAHTQAGEPFEHARTSMLLGEHLRRRKRRAEARPHLQRALHTFDQLEAAPWATRAREELRAAGGLSGAGDSESAVEVSPLTPQERSVAQAVAAGMSNREAAEVLFLSPRTIEYHLSNVYRKLGVHGRGALARTLDSVESAAPTPRG
jgi:DNA-binding CsgD family transcriptional regulator